MNKNVNSFAIIIGALIGTYIVNQMYKKKRLEYEAKVEKVIHDSTNELVDRATEDLRKVAALRFSNIVNQYED